MSDRTVKVRLLMAASLGGGVIVQAGNDVEVAPEVAARLARLGACEPPKGLKTAPSVPVAPKAEEATTPSEAKSDEDTKPSRSSKRRRRG